MISPAMLADPHYYKKKKKRLELTLEFVVSKIFKLLFKPRTIPDTKSIRNICIIRHNAIGDAVVGSVLIDALRNLFPEARITVIASSYNQKAFSWIPGTDSLHTWPRGLTQRLSMVRKLRQQNFDVTFQTLFDENYYSRTLVGRLIAGRSLFIGHDRGTPFASLMDHAITLPCGSYAAKLLSLLQPLSDIPLEELIIRFNRYKLIFSEEDRKAAIDRIKKISLRPREYIILNLSAREPSRNLSIEQAIKIAEQLTRTGEKILLSHAPTDKDRAIAVQQAVPTALRCDFKDLGEAMVAVSMSKIYIGPDTGSAHFAASTQTPCISLFHSNGRPESWSPWGTSFISIQAHPGECTENIDPLLIIEQARELLTGKRIQKIIKSTPELYTPPPQSEPSVKLTRYSSH